MALTNPKPRLGQYLLATLHTLRFRMHSVPAHIGIAGNEVVDTHAKEAAQDSSPLSSRIPLFESPLLTSKVAAIAAGTKEFNEHWLAKWSAPPAQLTPHPL
ncbi:hypothetical protein B0H17DRAFT_1147945 [Mycena rosella]|uniref:RNase H type-1 domain-containing protein n=1 Tax=Mycena rosella TaxID=1033263 RepID=A0AAD7CH89_MYCRO|nr:hypothetical protein B0H17DRAFT_1147945 [Mycena rosella]